MNTESIEVHLSVVTALQSLLELPNAPVGRFFIDYELNKKKDQAVAVKINNALRYLVQTGVFLKCMEDSCPKWWLSTRSTPTDKDGNLVVFQETSMLVIDWTVVNDVTGSKRAVKVVDDAVAIPVPTVVAASKVYIPKVAVNGKLSNDDRIVNEVTRLCGMLNKPVEKEHIVREVSKFLTTMDSRFVKMRLAFLCKVSYRLICWENSMGQILYWPADIEVPAEVTTELGSPNSYPPKTYVRKAKADKQTVVDLPDEEEFDAGEDTSETSDPEDDVVESSVVEFSPYVLHDGDEPVWSLDSRGVLSCSIDDAWRLILSPAHSLSLRRFLSHTVIDPQLG